VHTGAQHTCVTAQAQKDLSKTCRLRPVSYQDLRRAAINKALAVFVFVNKYAACPEEEDSKALMTVLALWQHVRQVRAAERARQAYCFMCCS
jgi:hypothetical protein